VSSPPSWSGLVGRALLWRGIGRWWHVILWRLNLWIRGSPAATLTTARWRCAPCGRRARLVRLRLLGFACRALARLTAALFPWRCRARTGLIHGFLKHRQRIQNVGRFGLIAQKAPFAPIAGRAWPRLLHLRRRSDAFIVAAACLFADLARCFLQL
jgi:hypothetical protein